MKAKADKFKIKGRKIFPKLAHTQAKQIQAQIRKGVKEYTEAGGIFTNGTTSGNQDDV